ncbi:SPFH domain-containing protein [Melioribacter sp. OK-6-Me]|uniref:SPFH domain-containing protein n=1 Tax=unclassified Melioribacter TaxID=2627329 RepID=UPI003EDB53FD
MWPAIVIIILVIILFLLYEYRLRKPDQLVLYESDGKIILKKGRFYPRHFCLVLPRTIHSVQLNIDSTAKGNLNIKIRMTLSVALSLENIHKLIKSGGWNTRAVEKATEELEILIESWVREFTEKYEIEELSGEKIYQYLSKNTDISKDKFGLEIVSISIQLIEILDSKIADAIKQQESARILEQTEELNQKARIAAAKAKFKAEEEIALMENQLEMKKYELKNKEIEKEAEIAEKRVKEELKRKQMQLEFESKELELLKNNPELLLLTPQAARLAEASQTLKNARTVVSLSSTDLPQGSELAVLFQNLLHNLTESRKKNSERKTE